MTLALVGHFLAVCIEFRHLGSAVRKEIYRASEP